MGFLLDALLRRFEEKERDVVKGATVIMISGCEDAQTSADVGNVEDFELPDPAGKAGGACTSTMLNVLYNDHQTPEDDLSFIEVLETMRTKLEEGGFTQIPQLTASRRIDVNEKFDLVPDGSTGARRAIMIGINYAGHEQGQLSGCHNDVLNMKDYIMDVHGFPEENITILMDDGEHEMPSKENIMAAYSRVVEESEEGDSVFLHYSGHGIKIPDDDCGEEEDGFDEALVPFDYKESGIIRDDDIYDMLVKPLQDGVTLFALYDCCHSGTILDLPYHFKPGEEETQMEVYEDFNFNKFLSKYGAVASDIFDE